MASHAGFLEKGFLSFATTHAGVMTLARETMLMSTWEVEATGLPPGYGPGTAPRHDFLNRIAYALNPATAKWGQCKREESLKRHAKHQWNLAHKAGSFVLPTAIPQGAAKTNTSAPAANTHSTRGVTPPAPAAVSLQASRRHCRCHSTTRHRMM